MWAYTHINYYNQNMIVSTVLSIIRNDPFATKLSLTYRFMKLACEMTGLCSWARSQ